MYRPPHPLKALLLAAIFLAGNLVLPGADVLLGHRLGQENETRVHLERLGGCSNHAEHCVLPRLFNDLGQQSPASSLHLAAAPRHAIPPRSADLRSATQRPPHQHLSRAPPTPLL